MFAGIQKKAEPHQDGFCANLGRLAQGEGLGGKRVEWRQVWVGGRYGEGSPGGRSDPGGEGLAWTT